MANYPTLKTGSTDEKKKLQKTTLPDYSQYSYNAAADPDLQQRQSAADQAYAQVLSLENPYDTNRPLLEDAYNQYANREDFSYDINADALYQQYKDIYTQQGQLAMMDTMGQAAALTGGYGNSYAQSVSQQAYQSYLQQLAAVVPELYQMAYDRYSDEGNALMNQYSMLSDMAANDQSVYQNELSNRWQNANYLQGLADTDYERGYQNWYNSLQLGTAAQDAGYSRLVDLMTQTGYTPTDAELSATGMTRSQANAIRNYYHPTTNSTGSSSGSGGYNDVDADTIKAMQAALGVTVDGIWGNESSSAINGLSAHDAWVMFQYGEIATDRAKKFFNSKDSREMWNSRGITDKEYAAMADQWLNSVDMTPAEFKWLRKKFGID